MNCAPQRNLAPENRQPTIWLKTKFFMTDTQDPFWKTLNNAKQYDEFTRTTFARIYPLIATQILERTEITKGTCLDVGSGPAPLAIVLCTSV